MDRKEVREWIKLLVSILGLIVLSIGIWFGINEIQNINVNLQELTSEKVATRTCINFS